MYKTNEAKFSIGKVIKKKSDKLYVKWKGFDNSFNNGFPKPYEPFGRDINVKADLSNYATKAYLKNATSIDASKLTAKFDLASLKSEVDKLDIDKLKIVPTSLSNLKSEADKLDIEK